jgi:hypothetical protein
VSRIAFTFVCGRLRQRRYEGEEAPDTGGDYFPPRELRATITRIAISTTIITIFICASLPNDRTAGVAPVLVGAARLTEAVAN